MRAFCSLMRVLRRWSKVERWCLMAFPLAASAAAAVVMAERTVAWESAMSLRRRARSEDCCGDGLRLLLDGLVVASESEDERPDMSISSSSSSTDDDAVSSLSIRSSKASISSSPDLFCGSSVAANCASNSPSTSGSDCRNREALLSLKAKVWNFSSSPSSKASSLSISSSWSIPCSFIATSGSSYCFSSESEFESESWPSFAFLLKGSSLPSSSSSASRLIREPVYSGPREICSGLRSLLSLHLFSILV